MSIQPYISATSLPKITGDRLVALDPNDIATITLHLTNVQGYLAAWGGGAAISATAKRFLPVGRGKATADTFKKVVLDLKWSVDQFLANPGSIHFQLARGSTANALGSATPARNNDNWLQVKSVGSRNLNLSFVIQAAFNNPYSVGGSRKKLTKFGRDMTILHELTHGLLGTRDYGRRPDDEKYGRFQGQEPDGWTPILGKQACLDFAADAEKSALTDGSPGSHMAWMNADSWAWALVSAQYPNPDTVPAETKAA